MDHDGNIESSKKIEEIANKLKKPKNELNLSFDDKIASDYIETISKGFKKRKINKSSNTLDD